MMELPSPAVIYLAANITTLVLVVLFSIPAFLALVRSLRRHRTNGERYSLNFYQDKDGEATKESIAEVSKKIYPIFNVVFAVVGCSTAIVRGVLAVVYHQPFIVEIWLQFGLWTSLVIQSTALLNETLYTSRFTLGLMKGCSCVIAIIALAFETYTRWVDDKWDDIQIYLMALQTGLAVAAMLLSFSFRRRPDVFRNGTVVDREFTASMLDRLSFSWAAPLIGSTARNDRIDISQLPELDLATRAKSQHDTFTWIESKMALASSDKSVTLPGLGKFLSVPGLGKSPLWRTLLLSNLPQLISQVLVSAPLAVLTFAPHLCLWQILQLLESRDAGASVAGKLLPWVIGLGVSIGLASLLENWNFWIAHNKISLRVYEQLSTIVFGKALRLDGALARGKDKKGPFRARNVINLVTVDVSRIVQATGLLYNAVVVPLKVAVAFSILERVLGWKSLLAGVASLTALTPVHQKFMDKSSEAEKRLSIRREEKITALTEATQGAHQIKFSALEGHWEAKVNHLRNMELLAQGIASGWKVASFSLWIFTPISASLASLSVYATVHGNLSPSVAFTAISALASLEVTVSALPDLVVQALHAWASLGVVEGFLNSPEKVSKTAQSETVEFENATVAWPGTTESSEDEQSEDSPGDSSSAPFGLSVLKAPLQAVKAPLYIIKGTVRGFKATLRGLQATILGIQRKILNLKERILRRDLSLLSDPMGANTDTPPEPQSDDSSSENEESPSKGPFTLSGLNAQFPKNGFCIIHGPTGSGKSLLLTAILGESEIFSGTVKAPSLPDEEEVYSPASAANEWILDSAMAYVPQIPWIEPSTIRENIVFGLPFIEGRYEKVVAACDLTRDFEILADKDMTELGPNGVNLSHGQRVRISLARALYSRAGVLVLDDIFAAVDGHTARHLYKHALTGELAEGRTRIVATNHVRLCQGKLDYLVYLYGGVMSSAGTVDRDLLDEFVGGCDNDTIPEVKHPSITRSVFSFFNQKIQDHVVDPLLERADPLLERAAANPFIERAAANPLVENAIERVSANHWVERAAANPLIGRVTSAMAGHSNQTQTQTNVPGTRIPTRFVVDEVGSNSITWKVFSRYVRACGGWYLWTPVALAFPVYIGLILAQNWIIKLWSSQPQLSPSGLSQEMQIYLGIYTGLTTAALIAATVGCFFTLTASMQASRRLFQQVMPVIFRTPLRWLDAVPLGRILSRLSSDFGLLDSRLGMDLTFMLCYLMQAVGVLVAGVMVTPLACIPVIFLLITTTPYVRRYLTATRVLKRVESTTRAPVYDLFDITSTGLSTIRTYKRGEVYMDRLHSGIDHHARACWNLWLVNRWVNFRLNAFAALFVGVSALITVLQTNMSASSAGFALAFALQLSTVLAMAVKAYANVELDMNAVERVLEYTDVGVEDHEFGTDAPENWPSKGRLDVSNLTMHYAPDLPPALDNVSFSVEPNQRIGIIGRTGAGKSSLALTVSRFLDAQSGAIHIDGVDISELKLSELRRKMAIIPQNPVLFTGTIRSNLDPYEEYKDEQLVTALQHVGWIESPDSHSPTPTNNESINGMEDIEQRIQGLVNTANEITNTADNMLSYLGIPKKHPLSAVLDTPVADGGMNFSPGQRQLLCLARAMVSAPKILILDEATSAMDNTTDAKIRMALQREEYASTTMVVIAHRLRTVAGFDKIIVLDEGRVVEVGSPKVLMGMNGVFRGLVEGDL